MFDKFDRKFSCERQDEFVYHLLAKHLKQPGTFLDCACGEPLNASNTYVLDKFLSWSGVGVDIGNVEIDVEPAWSTVRNAKFHQIDVTQKGFTDLLKKSYLPNQIIDYVSMDVDSPFGNFALNALVRFLDSGLRFRVMTFEHEKYKIGPAISDASRNLLFANGYSLLFKNVTFENGLPFEDWWVDTGEMIFDDIMSISAPNLSYNQCVELAKGLQRS